MESVKNKKAKPNPLNFFRKKINPEFRNFILVKLNKISELLKQLNEEITKEETKKLYKPKLEQNLKELDTIREGFEIYSSKFKYYTEDTEKSLRKLGFLTEELSKELEFSLNAYSQNKKELYLLNIENNWSTFSGNVKALYFNIEHSDYPYLIHTLFSLAFVFVPFLNIISLVGGIYLLMAKDYRALLAGSITLILYFIQIVNVVYLAVLA